MKRLDRSEFGPNFWLVDELYRRYLEDPDSVGKGWRDFFEDYEPRSGPRGGRPPEAPAAEEPTTAPIGAPGWPAAREEPTARPGALAAAPEPEPGAEAAPLVGAAAAIVRHMEESLGVPAATSVRTVPAKLLEVNREILNRYLARTGGGKVSFTHLIAFAVAQALDRTPGMNRTYALVDGKPAVVEHPHVNLGLAVDVQREDGSRVLLVPNIRAAEDLDFAAFHGAYEEVIRKVRTNALQLEDFAGTTVTITNPGTIGTVRSVPRLMSGQAAIVGVGAIGYPPEYQGADPETLAELGISKAITLTSTYDHRVIQGAESGEFLGLVHRLLLGEDRLYDEVFASMGVPYEPVRWHVDVHPTRDTVTATEKQARVLRLINNYRVRGHLIADLDPLGLKGPTTHPELDPATLGFSIWDLDRRFVTGGLAGWREATLGEILDVLRDAYCGTVGVEYMHIQEPAQKEWIQQRVEGVDAQPDEEDRRRILAKLNEAEAFERFLHRKYVGHKRFSLEGAESLIPALDAILDRAADAEHQEVVIGMAHRGRLNVLANIVGKSYRQIFREFEGDLDPASVEGSGDVRYHLGAEGTHRARSGRSLDVSVASNPSHLESVDPVVEGMVRAKQDRLGRGEEASVLPLLIHGEAAFAGQGVVAETLNLSQLPGYRTGGTVHIVINNQLGFTTGPSAARSSTYPSDVAKMVQAPIFHVNGDDPEAVVRVARLALEFRQAFGKDVVIDLWCYRRWGHNETDEPAFTQPLMYGRIGKLRSVRKRYTETLVNRGDLSVDDAEQSLDEFTATLRRAFDETRANGGSEPDPAHERRAVAGDGIGEAADVEEVEQEVATGVPRETLERVIQGLTTVPDGFHLHPKLAKWLDARARGPDEGRIDWALAESLAFGSLLLEGVTARLSGQDTRRGTFSQRHAALVDQETGEEHVPLATLAREQGEAFIYDSLLSEFAAVGFEYGYSVADPDALVCWEGQFGDFVNGAQVIVDQYLVAAEEKWGQRSGLVLLLPHGHEGQGPEHSSGRLERFLLLAAGGNLEIVVPSTAAQYFHLLRRQARRRPRRPLVAFTPKSLLRFAPSYGTTDQLTDGTFLSVLAEPASDPDRTDRVRRVLLCQGKLAYDLERVRAERGLEGEIAILRLERCYPFPAAAIREQLDRYPRAEIVWVQEEPENMGAGRSTTRNLRRFLGVEARRISRRASGSPATGSLRVHQAEQTALIDRALEGPGD